MAVACSCFASFKTHNSLITIDCHEKSDSIFKYVHIECELVLIADSNGC